MIFKLVNVRLRRAVMSAHNQSKCAESNLAGWIFLFLHPWCHYSLAGHKCVLPTMIIKMQWLLPGLGNSADRFAQVLFMMHLLLKVHCWCPIQGRRRRLSEYVYANCTNMLWRWAHYSLSKSLARRRKHTLAICGLLFDSTLLCRWQQQWAT